MKNNRCLAACYATVTADFPIGRRRVPILTSLAAREAADFEEAASVEQVVDALTGGHPPGLTPACDSMFATHFKRAMCPLLVLANFFFVSHGFPWFNRPCLLARSDQD